MIHYYRLIIQYKGTRYLGWQIQAENAGLTVQGELNKALTAVSKSKAHSLGSGRSDAGVHALGQVVKVAIELEIDPEKLLKALNGNLPEDIRVIDSKISDHDFMPTVHAISKEYHYRFTSTRQPTALQNDFIGNYPFDLDLEKMRDACKVLVGTHDFTNHFCQGTEVSTHVRTIFECEILEIPQDGWTMLPGHCIFRIVGDGFLKQMVRLLMGAVWNVGRGKISLDDFKASLSSTPTERIGATAPPQGLYMVRVNY
ncbi:MAG: tRNA pseudouridine(38-40) synthase TruA [Bdellovibrionales bacterium]|nr:tRNA pseudouridine(38-40) synthase TruA [Bdellovibrionales bacterium]